MTPSGEWITAFQGIGNSCSCECCIGHRSPICQVAIANVLHNHVPMTADSQLAVYPVRHGGLHTGSHPRAAPVALARRVAVMPNRSRASPITSAGTRSARPRSLPPLLAACPARSIRGDDRKQRRPCDRDPQGREPACLMRSRTPPRPPRADRGPTKGGESDIERCVSCHATGAEPSPLPGNGRV